MTKNLFRTLTLFTSICFVLALYNNALLASIPKEVNTNYIEIEENKDDTKDKINTLRKKRD